MGDEGEPEAAYSVGEEEGAGFCVEEDELENFGDAEYFVSHFEVELVFVRNRCEDFV